MAHSDAVADRYGIKFESNPPCLADSFFNNPGNLIKVDMPRHYLAEAVGNADERFVDVGVIKAAGVEQAPVRRPLEPFFYCIASHNPVSPKMVDEIT
jgi:hypothetical protein